MKSIIHRCLVCGFPNLAEPPRTAAGGGSFEICPSCGYQFGVDDEDRKIPYTTARSAWINGGMKWWSSIPKPNHWKPKVQLAALIDMESKAEAEAPPESHSQN